MINWDEVYANREEDRIQYDIKHNMNEFMPIMREIVKLFRPHTYVELGLRHGYTFNHMTALGIITRVVGVELDTKNLRGVKVKGRPGVELHNMSTDDFAEMWKDPIDMLFIDADHSFEQSKKDFDNLSKWISPCGIVCMHDTYPLVKRTYTEAWKTARAIFKLPEYSDWEIFTFPGTWSGLSLVRRAVTHLHYTDDEIELKEDPTFKEAIKDFSKLIDEKLGEL